MAGLSHTVAGDGEEHRKHEKAKAGRNQNCVKHPILQAGLAETLTIEQALSFDLDQDFRVRAFAARTRPCHAQELPRHGYKFETETQGRTYKTHIRDDDGGGPTTLCQADNLMQAMITPDTATVATNGSTGSNAIGHLRIMTPGFENGSARVSLSPIGWSDRCVFCGCPAATRFLSSASAPG
jgi:hypothetical protein